MRRLILIVFFAAPFFLFAQQEIISRNFLPAEFYVGDTVELRLLISGLDEQNMEEARIPTLDWGLIKSIEKKKTGSHTIVSIIFVPYQPGRHYIPSISFGDYTLEEQEVIVTSLYSLGHTQPEPYRPVMISGRAKSFIVFFLVFSVIFILLLLSLVRDRFRIIKRLFIYIKLFFVRKTMLYRLNKLGKQIETIEKRTFFDILVDTLRQFMALFFLLDISAMTSREILCEVQRKEIDIEPEKIRTILLSSDMVKFAHKNISSSECLAALDTLCDIIKKHKIIVDNQFIEGYSS
ncbi:hypothetical protein WKV44_07425 [Spirochaetia bacterium 38H-sp]|uniref:Uncharacterized protein n=1 Tax=Rarispira pelagica TaxID=3141764 RepID=A0ABU9UCH4_9SPIR